MCILNYKSNEIFLSLIGWSDLVKTLSECHLDGQTEFGNIIWTLANVYVSLKNLRMEAGFG